MVAIGISVNEQCPRTGVAPLQLASVAGESCVCELLLDALADVQPEGTEKGMTALALARRIGNPEVVEMLEVHISRLNAELDDTIDPSVLEKLPASAHLYVLPRVPSPPLLV